MRQNFRFPIMLLTAFSLLGIPSMLVAQQGKKTAIPVSNDEPAGKSAVGKPSADQTRGQDPPANKKPRPAPQDPQIDPIPPDLQKLLAQWEIESAKIKSLHGKHTRKEFNKTFEVEKVSEGEFFLELPDKGRIDMMAKAFKKDDVSTRKNAKGMPYKLEKGSSERWICTGEEIIVISEEDRTYRRDELPENMRGKNIVHSPLPFLFGMKAAEAKNRFNITLQSIDKEKETATLKVIPRMDSDRQNYHEAWIILNTKQYTPTAVRLFDPNGLETIYQFKDVAINDGGFGARIVARFRGNPYKPNLKDYKRHIPPNEVEPASDRIRGGANQTQQAGGPASGSRSPNRDVDSSPNARTQLPRTTAVPQPGKAR